jgi:hypothetical protein
MLSTFLAAAIAIGPVQKAPPTGANASALAVVRIVRGTEVRFGKPFQFEAAVPRVTRLRERDGTTRPASLIEFY